MGPILSKYPNCTDSQAQIVTYIDFTDLYNMKVDGTKVSFIDKSQISVTNGCFLFHTVNVEESKAFVRYYFTYNINNIEKVIPITIDFVKEGSSWRIINYTI